MRGGEEQRLQNVNGIECSVGDGIGEKKKQKSKMKQRYQLQRLERHAGRGMFLGHLGAKRATAFVLPLEPRL